ncbi:Dabb family protein [Aurantibacter crassamenti]|uniref:Dabb family protein n=1 Tax=Aurantibacter crassamenti TaxID=1837375 RepID=UPI0019392FBC|nr:Dabb family protein [Aurantibacter crassamenti]MBM1106395.1 Dabb family protein [Aurantibacter crassamenti]
MKKYGLSLVMMLGILACGFTTKEAEKAEKTVIMETAKTQDSVLRHVVLFKFKDDTSAENIKKVVDAFSALPSKIPQIVGYEWGINNSPEGLNKGLTHGFLLTFNSEADRDIYLPHPEHKAFGAILGPHLEDVTVFDYWSKSN